MIIRKQPVISWLLKDELPGNEEMLGVPMLNDEKHFGYLVNGFIHLDEIRKTKPDWGLPELIMPSFEEVMKKNAKSFFHIDHQLFQEFYQDNVCGILLSKDCGTIVYGFGENRLYVWLYEQDGDASRLYLYFYVESTPDNKRKLYNCPTLTNDSQLFNQESVERDEIYANLVNKLIIYLAVKKYVRVERVVIPQDGIVKVSDVILDYKFKDKIRNISGQEVIVMDSRYFRKIINDNDIHVRGYFRIQNEKLVFVNSHIRHGYHRNALIENEEDRQTEEV